MASRIKPLQAFKESLANSARRRATKPTKALCLNNIGTAYPQKGENEDALTYLQQALQIREKLNVPATLPQTLHNLGEAYAALGQYDQAMTAYMRGLDLYRKSGDKQGAAIMSHSMGLVFEYQGRLRPCCRCVAGCSQGVPGSRRSQQQHGSMLSADWPAHSPGQEEEMNPASYWMRPRDWLAG